MELAHKINSQKTCQDQCTSINKSLSHFKAIFKNAQMAASKKTPGFISGRDGRLQGMLKPFLENAASSIISIFCLCPSVEFLLENNSVLDFCEMTNVSCLFTFLIIFKEQIVGAVFSFFKHLFLNLNNCNTNILKTYRIPTRTGRVQFACGVSHGNLERLGVFILDRFRLSIHVRYEVSVRGRD